MRNEALAESTGLTDFRIYRNMSFQESSLEKKLLDITVVGCENCNVVTPAKIIENGSFIFLEKECCGQKVFLDDNPELFKKLYLRFLLKDEMLQMNESLEDFTKRVKKNAAVMMLYVNSKCNLNCPICYLKFSNDFEFGQSKDGPIEDIEEILQSNKKSKLVCICGTEPTLRDDLPNLIKKIVASGKHCDIVTNGFRFLDKKYLKSVKDAGIWRVHTWLDGLDDEIYEKLRGGKFLGAKLRVLKNLKEENIQTELISVIGKGINENQIPLLVDFALKNRSFITGINFDCLTTGKTHTKYTIGASTIHKLIADSIGIDLEYFIEFKRLRYNLYFKLKKFSRFFSNYQKLVLDNYFFKIENEKLYPVISIRNLKRINDALENRNMLKRVAGFIKNFGSFIRLFNSMAPRVLPLYLPNYGNEKVSNSYFKIGVLKVAPFGETAGYKGNYSYVENTSASTPIAPRIVNSPT
jgi:uncharacterized radical SAM superfamily Fe-S cluster-containing enzyme